MLSILTIIAPVFGIIAIGYGAGRSGYLPDTAGRGIADFAFKVAIPALLFKTILLANFTGVAPLGILASFFGAGLCVWLLATGASRLLLGRPAADGPAVAMCSVFGNTIMLGLPIGVATFGPQALAPISVILAIHAPVFLLAATAHSVMAGDRGGGALKDALAGIAADIVRQPVIVAIAAAALCRLTGVTVPGPLLVMAEMLASAGVPAALVALGLTLRSFKVAGDARTLSLMLVLKLAIQPVLAGILAVGVFRLPPVSADVVILLAALPAGANAYLYAVHAGRAVNAASGAVATGTALSAITLAALIAGFRAAG